MNVLVTGGAGYIGSHACKALARAGFRPVVYDNFSTGHREFVRWGPAVAGDIRDTDALEDALRRYCPVIVMHFAAKSLVGESVRQPKLYHDVNVGGTASLLSAMQKTGGSRLVLSSSCAVYGDAGARPLTEDYPISPMTPYGATKAEAERLAMSCGNIRTVTLRYFNAAGADPDLEVGERHDPETHLVPLVLDAAAGERPEIKIFGADHPTRDGTPIRDYVHVVDIAAAHLAATKHLLSGDDGMTLNLGTGTGHSVREVIETAVRVTGHTIPIRLSTCRAGDPPSLTADGRKARSCLNWRAERSELETILADAWAWHRVPRCAAA